jgi:hypothetical protein
LARIGRGGGGTGKADRRLGLIRLEPALQQLLALLGALLALVLGLAEEVREVGVVLALGVLDVALQAKSVRQALLGEPDDVVVLVLGAGDVAGLGGAGLHWA